MAKYGSEEYQRDKEVLNKEGFVKDEGGEGAVFVGTKEEAEAARKRAETEGQAPDLESYVRLNKEVLCSKEELIEVLSTGDIDKFNSAPNGSILNCVTWFEGKDNYEVGFFYYKDNQGNIAKVKFDARKVGDYGYGQGKPILYNRILELGFTSSSFSINSAELETALKNKRAQKMEKEKKEGFNF